MQLLILIAHLIGEAPVRLMKHTSRCACEGVSWVSQQDTDTLRAYSISGFKSQEHFGGRMCCYGKQSLVGERLAGCEFEGQIFCFLDALR